MWKASYALIWDIAWIGFLSPELTFKALWSVLERGHKVNSSVPKSAATNSLVWAADSHFLDQHLCPMAGLVSGVNNDAHPAPPPWCCMDCHVMFTCLFRKNWVRAQLLKPLRLDKILALLNLKSCSLQGSSFTTLSSDYLLNDHGNYPNQLLSATLRKGKHICLKVSYVFFCCAV